MPAFRWVVNEELKEALNKVFSGYKPSLNDAKVLLKLLKDETSIYLRRCLSDAFCKQFFPTTRHGGSWVVGDPAGLVDHYTADQSTKGTLIWFSSSPRKEASTSSSHLVIDHDGTVFTLVDPLTTIAWHATSANHDHIGIENVNCGVLKCGAENVFRCMSGLYAVKAEPPQLISDQWWDPFETEILISNLVMKRLLIAAIPTLQRGKFVEHHQITPAKQDCGPLWPLNALNDLAFSWKDATSLESLKCSVVSAAGVGRFEAEVSSLLAT